MPLIIGVCYMLPISPCKRPALVYIPCSSHVSASLMANQQGWLLSFYACRPLPSVSCQSFAHRTVKHKPELPSDAAPLMTERSPLPMGVRPLPAAPGDGQAAMPGGGGGAAAEVVPGRGAQSQTAGDWRAHICVAVQIWPGQGASSAAAAVGALVVPPHCPAQGFAYLAAPRLLRRRRFKLNFSATCFTGFFAHQRTDDWLCQCPRHR